ncbi:putative syntaxin binding protein 1 [Trypanosoma cruzi]|uniref:Putative syntaxin binding protein 1 n=1 Tax=Trypanosoma cruzi TaxID=5693 RepID=A0A2V2XJP0_TRYCR|nr:putative syntaxin binding protein 1 [Trypanosoma cruzi]
MGLLGISLRGLPSSATTSRISLRGADSRGNPVRIIVDWGCVTVTPLMQQRTCRCLLDDLMPLENNLYEQTRRNRLGVDSKRQQLVDEEDVYWRSYRHCFLAQCVEELSVALKNLHAYHPGLAHGVEPKANLAELSSAVRSPPEFRERQARLSLHIDFLREACGTVPGEATGGGVGGGTRHRRWAQTPQEKPGWRAATGEGCGDAPASATASSVACGCEQHRRVDGGQEAAADPRRWTDARRPFVCET